jgi:quercetin dioxygenase-like cupin family protein
MGFSTVNLRDIEPAGPGGMVHFVRRELGAEAFGINWFEFPPGAEGLEHDEADTGQEEVNVVIRGSGVYRIDGEDHPMREGDFFRFDPDTVRRPVAGPEGMTVLAVGSPPGSYAAHGPF